MSDKDLILKLLLLLIINRYYFFISHKMGKKLFYSIPI